MFPRKKYGDLVRRITSGDRPVVPGPVDRAAKSSMTSGKSLAVGSLPVPRIANVVVLPRFGTWYSLNITRMNRDGAPYCRNPTLIPVWG